MSKDNIFPEDVFKKMIEDTKLNTERMLIDDIIFIYEHPYLSYERYTKLMADYNSECIKKNYELKPGVLYTNYLFHPQRVIVSKEVFDYIEKIGNENHK